MQFHNLVMTFDWGGPIDTRLMRLTYILQDLMRDTHLTINTVKKSKQCKH